MFHYQNIQIFPPEKEIPITLNRCGPNPPNLLKFHASVFKGGNPSPGQVALNLILNPETNAPNISKLTYPQVSKMTAVRINSQ